MPASTTAGPAAAHRAGMPGAGPVRVTVTGHTSCADRDQAAQVEAIAVGLARMGPVRLTVTSQTPAADTAHFARAPVEVRFVADPHADGTAWPAEAVTADRAGTDQTLAETDVLIALAGHQQGTAAAASTLQAAVDAGVPGALLIGRVDAAEAPAAAAAAALAEVVAVHDAASWRHLTAHLDLRTGPRVTVDPAYLLPPAGPGRYRSLLAATGLDAEQEWLCLAPSADAAAAAQIDQQAHRDRLAVLAEALYDRWRVPIVLTPFVHGPPDSDDRRLTAALAARLGGRCRVLAAGASARDLRAVIAGSRLLIAERPTAALAGYAAAVATVTIGGGPAARAAAEHAYGTPEPLAAVDLDALMAAPVRLADRFDPIACPDLARALAGRAPRLRRDAAASIALLAPLLARAARTDQGPRPMSIRCREEAAER